MFIEDTLANVRLPDDLIRIIMKCVTSATMKVPWNRDLFDTFPLSQCIRQGNPLSPYIFILCIERLSNLINREVDKGNWKPIRFGRDKPKISHLFFVNDVILFVEAYLRQVNVLQNV